ncbi:hypothetical protein RFI_26540, partial [Reticulomyxa filosa]
QANSLVVDGNTYQLLCAHFNRAMLEYQHLSKDPSVDVKSQARRSSMSSKSHTKVVDTDSEETSNAVQIVNRCRSLLLAVILWLYKDVKGPNQSNVSSIFYFLKLFYTRIWGEQFSSLLTNGCLYGLLEEFCKNPLCERNNTFWQGQQDFDEYALDLFSQLWLTYENEVFEYCKQERTFFLHFVRSQPTQSLNADSNVDLNADLDSQSRSQQHLLLNSTLNTSVLANTSAKKQTDIQQRKSKYVKSLKRSSNLRESKQGTYIILYIYLFTCVKKNIKKWTIDPIAFDNYQNGNRSFNRIAFVAYHVSPKSSCKRNCCFAIAARF